MIRHLFTITTPAGFRYDVKEVRDIPRRWGEVGVTYRRSKRGQVRIVAAQKPKERLDTLIHEMLHAIEPRWREGKVQKTAACLARAVWKDEWRRKTGRSNG